MDLYNASSWDAQISAYNGGTLPEATVTASAPDGSASGGGGGSVWDNIGGYLTGIAQIGNAWANIQSAQNGGSPSAYTPPATGTAPTAPNPGGGNMWLLIGGGVLALILILFLVNKK